MTCLRHTITCWSIWTDTKGFTIIFLSPLKFWCIGGQTASILTGFPPLMLLVTLQGNVFSLRTEEQLTLFIFFSCRDWLHGTSLELLQPHCDLGVPVIEFSDIKKGSKYKNYSFCFICIFLFFILRKYKNLPNKD